MMKQLKHSQNFTINKKVLEELVQKSGIDSKDTVIDIGAGKGAIVDELISFANKIIAIEPDIILYQLLVSKYHNYENIELINDVFGNYNLPKSPYKIFSNIPFNSTAEIIKKLLQSRYFLSGFLFVQKEACEKFSGEQVNKPNTLMSVLYGVDFEFSIVHFFSKFDFSPKPNVQIVSLYVNRRKAPLIDDANITKFRDFVSFIFNNSNPNIENSKILTKAQILRFKKEISLKDKAIPSQIKTSQFIQMYQIISQTEKIRLSEGSYERYLKQQSNIHKVFRTRIDTKWRNK